MGADIVIGVNVSQKGQDDTYWGDPNLDNESLRSNQMRQTQIIFPGLSDFQEELRHRA
jgi:hypothetical protein